MPRKHECKHFVSQLQPDPVFLHRRTSAERETGETWRYDYNDRGEVESAVKKADNTETAAPKRGLQSGYGYDLIGNRVMDQQHTPSSGSGLSEAAWTANALNQITAREQHDSRWVFGHVKEAAALTVTGNSGAVIREGDEFAVPVSRSGAAVDADWHSLDVTATLAGAGRVVDGTPLDVTTQRQGKVWFPASPESLAYDDDGNLTQDGRWTFTWNAENRLTRAETRADVAAATGMPRLRLDMAYDAMGRRIRKVVQSFSSTDQAWQTQSDLRFLYEGTSWNLIAEIEMSPSLPVSSSPRLLRSYAWGTDISGTVTGAGGVGGLLFVKQLSTTVNNSQPSSTVSAPCYDGNGNISAYVRVQSGTVSSRHDYDAFGRPVWSELESTGGRQVAASPFGFSTKYTDVETGWVYYGYRHYIPELARWPSRDPIGEQGGINLYGMVGNDPVNRWDYLGLVNKKLVWVYPEDMDIHPFEDPVTGKMVFDQQGRPIKRPDLGKGSRYQRLNEALRHLKGKMKESDRTEHPSPCYLSDGDYIGPVVIVVRDQQTLVSLRSRHTYIVYITHGFPEGTVTGANGQKVSQPNLTPPGGCPMGVGSCEGQNQSSGNGVHNLDPRGANQDPNGWPGALDWNAIISLAYDATKNHLRY